MGRRTVTVPRKAEIARAALPMFAPFGILMQEDCMSGIGASPGNELPDLSGLRMPASGADSYWSDWRR